MNLLIKQVSHYTILSNEFKHLETKCLVHQ